MERLYDLWDIFRDTLSRINISATDIAEMLILAFLLYYILVWVQNTRAWVLFKGMVVIAIFLAIAGLLEMNIILWIAEQMFSVAIMAIIIILQPELRKALEDLGQNNFVQKLHLIEKKAEEGRFSDKTLQSVLNASVAMGKVKTGALIVIERKQKLDDYAATGILLDAEISTQLLVNIFEHNTPLHDGAVILRGDRILAATCYLPLSDNRALSKELGTRHRAALGASENTDAMVIVVSEETGAVSVAREGKLYRHLGPDGLQEHLARFQEKDAEEASTKKTIIKKWKGAK